MLTKIKIVKHNNIKNKVLDFFSGTILRIFSIISKLRSNLKASQKIGLSTYINNINL